MYGTGNVTYEVQERFLEFVDCNHKTGEAIAELINETLRKNGIPLADCRGQGYDNGSSMSGVYKGAQVRIIQNNQLARFCSLCLPQSKFMRGVCCRTLS